MEGAKVRGSGVCLTVVILIEGLWGNTFAFNSAFYIARASYW